MFSQFLSGNLRANAMAAVAVVQKAAATDPRLHFKAARPLLTDLLTKLILWAPRYVKHIMAVFMEYVRAKASKLYVGFDYLLLLFIDILRLFSGLVTCKFLDTCKTPEKLLVLYEFEGCPFCRRVREALNVLALDYCVRPCPRETLKKFGYCKEGRFRKIMEMKGKPLIFPYLEDPNTGQQIQQSSTIIEYLFREYGATAAKPFNYKLATIGIYEALSLTLTTFCRPMMTAGILRTPAHQPAKPLELNGCEASPFGRRVRESLSCLELPYVMYTNPIVSDNLCIKKYSELLELMLNPFRVTLFDPNTNVKVTSASGIIEYLKKTYQISEPPKECWLDYGADQDKED